MAVNKDNHGNAQDGNDIFKGVFDIRLTELKAPAKEEDSPQVASRKLIDYTTLTNLASNNGYTLRTLPISQLRSRFSAGYFCLKMSSSSLMEISGSTTLAEYAKRQPNAVVSNETNNPAISIFWTQTVTDLAKALAEVKEPKLGDATPPEVTKFGLDTIDTTSAIDAAKNQMISMKDAKAGDSLYELGTKKWSQVVEGNELLFAFQVNIEQTDRLRSLQTSALLASASASDTTSDVTATSSADPWNLIQRCARPAFVLAPDKSTGAKESDKNQENSGHSDLFWSQPMSEAKTEFSIAKNSLQIWSTRSGMSKKSLDIGASIPIGKATLGAKFGFEREKTQTKNSKTADSESHFLAVHSIPKAQVNVNETTVALSADAEAEIKKLRRERRFKDLLRFYDKFGTLVFQNVVLGGRLYHVQNVANTSTQVEQTDTSKLKTSANASLGIPGKVDGNLGGSYERGDSQTTGKLEQNSQENLSWTCIGGNASMSVDPPKWRDSLGDYVTWRPIQYDNAVRIDNFIGRLEGYSDVPVLFAGILATGVLDRSVITIPPNGPWQSKDTKLSLGARIESKTGSIVDPPPSRKSVASVKTLVAPAGFSWAVFSTDRNLKREIRANLQSNLNPMVKVSYLPPFLSTLRADKDTFTIMLRWTSDTWKETEDDAITKRMQTFAARRNYAYTSEADEITKIAAEAKAARDALAAAEDAGKNDDEKAKNADRRKLEWEAADKAEGTKIGAQMADRAKLITEENTLGAGNYYIQSLTSRAWVIGVWIIKKTDQISDDDFMEHRVAFEKEFSGPKSIEEGCDYIVAKALSEDSKISATFKMYASDYTARDEISQPKDDQTTSARNAFEYIDARMRLSSIHFLYVKGEIVNYDGTTPAQSPLNEPALLQLQEAQAGTVFLQTKGKEIKSELATKISKCENDVADKAKAFDVAIFDGIRTIEDELVDEMN